ncbi:MAG: NAD(P)-dependent oxidoreductase [Alphaproteobacteria bacterium]|nr:NAD(P)-dependent oxidoreductase [Alphaproteobacteria bacterium]
MSRLVAVTGATGFIGQHLLKLLASRGHRLRLLVRSLPSSLPVCDPPIELQPGDLRDRAALERLVEGADAVVHLAGAIKALTEADFHAVNVDAVAALAGATARHAQLDAHFLLMSSLAARESALSAYAATKRAGEDALSALGPKQRRTVVRAPAVYGPGDRETLVFFKAAARGWSMVPAGTDGRVALIHVQDLCAAVAGIIDRPPPDDIYEIDDGTEGGHTLRSMAAVAAEIMGRKVRIAKLPHRALGSYAALQQITARMRGQPAIVSAGKVRELLHPDWSVHDRRLAAWLRLGPAIELRAGFAETVGWYRAQRWL